MRESDIGFSYVRPRPAKRVEHHQRYAIATRVDVRKHIGETPFDHFLGQTFRELVAANRVPINGIGHHTGGQVMGHVEQGRLPRAPGHRIVAWGAEPVRECRELLRGRQQPLYFTHPLFEFDAAAVNALKDWIALTGDDRQVRTRDLLKIRGNADAQRKGHIRLPIELLNQRRHVQLRLRDIHSRQSDAVAAARKRRQRIVALLHEFGEAWQVLRRTVQMPIRKRQPKRGDAAAVDAFPKKFRRHRLAILDSSEKPKRIEPCELQNLWHLRMVPERVEQPADFHIDSEHITAIALRVKHLAHERFAAGHIIIRHNVQPADDLQPALGDKLAKGRGLFRIALQKRFEVGHLVQSEPIIRMLLEQAQRRQNVRKADFQVLLACLEHGPFPMRVRNQPKSRVGAAIHLHRLCTRTNTSQQKLRNGNQKPRPPAAQKHPSFHGD